MGPVRTCLGCRSTDQRSVLLRIVVMTDGAGLPALVVDVGRCMPGRGAWLHPDPRCFELAERRRAFPRALRHAGTLDAAAVEAYLAAP
ncbi:YlxR family protein [Cellulomonas sp.]|uniref:YlxR family protein n=1 Tax=Cellulomonas sp. TaxID=40001 RepID=UPI00344B7FCA